MDRRERVDVFRKRLQSVIDGSGLSRSAFASQVGMDRSTLSQVLSRQTDRLPRLETVAAIAAESKASIDWLIGLEQERRGDSVGAGVVDEGLGIEENAGAMWDERLTTWHAEAAGYKIRYVPTTLPDLLKNETTVRYEHRHTAGGAERGLNIGRTRLSYQRRPDTDMEVCNSVQCLRDFAAGAGIWRDLPASERRTQLLHMAALTDELYPTFRWFLYDGRQRYCVPVTVFGPKRAVIYVGQIYLVFTTTPHIQTFTRQFDDLIRAAVVQPNDVPRHLQDVAATVP